MSLSYWKIGANGALTANAGTAGEYISRELGLTARKRRAENAMLVMKEPALAVEGYNAELKALEDAAGAEFVKFQKKAWDLGFSEEDARNYAKKRAAEWLSAEIELLDIQRPFAGNTGLLINAQLGAPLVGMQGMQVAPDSSIPVETQHREPIRGRAVPAAPARKKAPARRGKGKGRK